MIEEFRKIRQERNDIRESLLNTSVLVSYDQMSQSILHQYTFKRWRQFFYFYLFYFRGISLDAVVV